MYILFKLKSDVHLFITSNMGYMFPIIIAKINIPATKETNIENSWFVFFKIKQIDTAIKDKPTIENNIFLTSI